MGFQLGESVWSREGGYFSGKELTKRVYIGAVSGFTVFGLLLAIIVARATMTWTPNIVLYLLVGLGIPIAGVFITLGSDKPVISLVGYCMVIIGLGAITGPTIALYKTGVVMIALMATGGVSVLMSLVGILYPKSLESWGGYLFSALLAVLFVRVGQSIMAGFGVSESIWYVPWLEYGIAVLFSAYIVYDWNRALRLPRTLDNAVDCALAIFLDIINLFITILRIMGNKK